MTEGYAGSGATAPVAPSTIGRLRELLNTLALRRDRPVELSNGSKSTFYFDCKRVTLHPKGAVLIGEAFLDKLMARFPDVEAVGGLVNGASPIVNAIIMLSNDGPRPLQGFYVRPRAKAHGLKHLIENEPHVGTKVVIVDDVVTSGSSLLEAAGQAKDQGCIVIGAISLVDRSAGGAAKIQKVVPEYEPIFTKDKDFPDPG